MCRGMTASMLSLWLLLIIDWLLCGHCTTSHAASLDIQPASGYNQGVFRRYLSGSTLSKNYGVSLVAVPINGPVPSMSETSTLPAPFSPPSGSPFIPYAPSNSPFIPYSPPSGSPFIPYAPSDSPFIPYTPTDAPFIPFFPPSDSPSQNGPLEPFNSPTPAAVPVIINPLPTNLTGLCSLNFTALGTTVLRTAIDCATPLAAWVGDVICCPQVHSLVRILQGQHALATGALAFNSSEATNCFNDTLSVLFSNGASTNIPNLCNIQPSNFTAGSCPITDVTVFEELVNTTSLLQACQAIDPVKECSKHVCQSAITNAAKQLTLTSTETSVADDCQSLVLSWISAQHGSVASNEALRSLISCQVNEECPLHFGNTSTIAEACRSPIKSNKTCCEKLQQLVWNDLQDQILITNLQAYRCSSLLGLMLQNQSVITNIYDLCDIDLRDFSLQGQQDQGCLLSSLPTDVERDTTGLSFTCDLNDNINAQWPIAPSPASTPTAYSPTPSPTPSLGAALYVGSSSEVLVHAFGLYIIIGILV